MCQQIGSSWQHCARPCNATHLQSICNPFAHRLIFFHGRNQIKELRSKGNLPPVPKTMACSSHRTKGSRRSCPLARWHGVETVGNVVRAHAQRNLFSVVPGGCSGTPLTALHCIVDKLTHTFRRAGYSSG